MSLAHFSIVEKVILAGLTLAALGSFSYEVLRRVLIVQKGLGSFPFDRFGERLLRVFREVILHEKVIRERPFPGLMHALVFWGFLVFGCDFFLVSLASNQIGEADVQRSTDSSECWSGARTGKW